MFYKPYPKSIELAERMRIELFNRWLDSLEEHYEGYINDDFQLPDDDVSRPCTIKWMDGFSYPVLSVEYMGMLPHYDESMNIKGMVRDMYQRAFRLANTGVPLKHRFEQSHIFVLHYFSDQIIRDLDNRYVKFLVDNLRHHGYISNDDWKSVSLTELGLYGDETKVVMYVVDQTNLTDFLLHYIEPLRKKSDQNKNKPSHHELEKEIGFSIGRPENRKGQKIKSNVRESLF